MLRKIYKLVIFLSVIALIGNLALFIYATSWVDTNIETVEEQAEFLEYLANDLIFSSLITLGILAVAIFLLTMNKRKIRY